MLGWELFFYINFDNSYKITHKGPLQIKCGLLKSGRYLRIFLAKLPYVFIYICDLLILKCHAISQYTY